MRYLEFLGLALWFWPRCLPAQIDTLVSLENPGPLEQMDT
jgi:hypothetical protein